jgi:hypothetical protein
MPGLFIEHNLNGHGKRFRNAEFRKTVAITIFYLTLHSTAHLGIVRPDSIWLSLVSCKLLLRF